MEEELRAIAAFDVMTSGRKQADFFFWYYVLSYRIWRLLGKARATAAAAAFCLSSLALSPLLSLSLAARRRNALVDRAITTTPWN